MVNFNGDPHTHPHPHPQPLPLDNNHFNQPYNGHNGNAFPSYDHHQQHHNHNHNHNHQYQFINPPDSGFPPNNNNNNNNPQSMPRPPRKRAWSSTSPDQVDGVKVYVAPVPRTSTEADVRLVFEGHGTIVEVVLLRDKRTGARQGSCFVKYATFDEADRAIKALSNQYTFPGELCPVVVRFADRELERLGFGRNMEKKDHPSEGFGRNVEKKDHLSEGFGRNMEKKDHPSEEVLADKVFVSFINREASKKDIEEIFSTYGNVEDVFIAQSRGYAFVKFSSREMAQAAIKGLNRTFTMRGCDHPLIVRFADPKKPKTGEPRGNCLSGNANFGPCSQEPAVWPVPNFGDPNMRGSMMPIAPHHSTMPHPQVAPNMQNWQPGAPMVQPPFPPQQPHPQMASMPWQSFQAPKLSSQPFVTEVQRQSHPADSTVQNIDQQLSSQLPTQSGSNSNTVGGTASPDMPTSPQDEEFAECDWSEHYCPDGHKYYYNCVTCESRWEKPEECALDEKESQKQQEQEDSSCLMSQLSLSSTEQVAQSQQETNHDHGQSETSPVVAQVRLPAGTFSIHKTRTRDLA